jgi:hypothetical protein
MSRFYHAGAAVIAFVMTLCALYCGGQIVSHTVGWLQARAYVPVPAAVTQVAISPSPTARRGDFLRSVQVEAQFAYRYNNTDYLAERIAVSDFGDGYKRGLYRSLYAAKTLENPVTLWVDPQAPQRAVYERRLRPILLAVMAPMMLGFAALALTGWLYLWIVRSEKGRAPRLRGPTGRATISAQGKTRRLALAALAVNIFAVPNTLLAMETSQRFAERANGDAYIALALGLGLLLRLAWIRYAERGLGETILKLQVRHDSHGGAALQGRITFDPPLGDGLGAHPARQQLTITLRCQGRDRSIPPTNWPVLAQPVSGGSRWIDFPARLDPERDPTDSWSVVLDAEGIRRTFELPADEIAAPL